MNALPTPPPTPASTVSIQSTIMDSPVSPTMDGSVDAPILIGVLDDDTAAYEWIIQPRSLLPALLQCIHENL